MTEKTDLLNTKEVADFLDVSPNTVRLWREKERGPEYFQRGYKRYFYKLADVKAFAKEMGYDK